jgi:hypothetical protein
MWSEKPASAEDQIGRYWDDLVTGAPLATDIEPSLQQTIAWLERIDDVRLASAEFSRRFETQFLSAIGAANSRAEASTEPLVWRPKQRPSGCRRHRLHYQWSGDWQRRGEPGGDHFHRRYDRFGTLAIPNPTCGWNNPGHCPRDRLCR